MKHTLIFIVSVSAAIASTACSTTVICEGENCQGTGGTGASTSQGGGSAQGGSAQGGSSQGGAGAQGGTSSVGGGTPGLAQFCDDMCACEGCGSFELQDCYDEVNQLVGDALDAGCQAELGWLEQCFADTLQCINGSLQLGCEKELSVLFECMEGAPPPSTICDAAFQICGEPGEPPPCDGEMLCISQCIVNAGHCDVDQPGLNACVNGCFN